MLDLVGNPEDRFSRVAAQMVVMQFRRSGSNEHPQHRLNEKINKIIFLVIIRYTFYVVFWYICSMLFTDPPSIHTVLSSNADGTSSQTLICNLSSAHRSPTPPSYRWLQPDGMSSLGNTLVINNVTSRHSGKYVCLVTRIIDGEEWSASASTIVDTGNDSDNFCDKIVQGSHGRVPSGTGKHGKWLKIIPCMENSWNLKNDEISWKNHGILL